MEICYNKIYWTGFDYKRFIENELTLKCTGNIKIYLKRFFSQNLRRNLSLMTACLSLKDFYVQILFILYFIEIWYNT